MLNGDQFNKLSLSSDTESSSQLTSQSQVNISLVSENESANIVQQQTVTGESDNLQIVVNNNADTKPVTSSNVKSASNEVHSDDEDEEDADDEDSKL